MATAELPLFYWCILTANLCAVAYYDLRTRKIKNFWSLANLLFLPMPFFLATDITPYLVFTQILIPVIVFVLGIFLFTKKLMGAGDSKYLSTFLLILPFQLQIVFVSNLLLLTASIGLILLGIKIAALHPSLSYFATIRFNWQDRFPYAPVFLMSWIWIILEII